MNLFVFEFKVISRYFIVYYGARGFAYEYLVKPHPSHVIEHFKGDSKLYSTNYGFFLNHDFVAYGHLTVLQEHLYLHPRMSPLSHLSFFIISSLSLQSSAA